jgi:hypothetical protein
VPLVLLFVCCGGVGVVAVVARDSLSSKWAALFPKTSSVPTTEPSEPGPAPQPNPPKEVLDLSYIAADFNAAVIVHGKRIAKSPLLAEVPQEKLLADLIKATGVDPREVERAVILLEPTPGGNVLFLPAGIIRFAGPVDGKAILAKALKASEEATVDDKRYSRSKTEKMAKVPMAGYIADDRTLLIAPEPTLKKMLTARDAKSPLLDHLRKIDLDSDVIATLAMEPIRPMVGEFLKQSKDQVPPSLAGVLTLHERLKFATVSVNLDGDRLVQIVLEAVDEESATILNNVVMQGRNMANLMYPDLRKQFTGQLPPNLVEPVTGVTDQLLDGLSVSRNGTQVIVTLKTPRGLGDLIGKLVPLLPK